MTASVESTIEMSESEAKGCYDKYVKMCETRDNSPFKSVELCEVKYTSVKSKVF
jgi:hypothetical protein